MCYQGIPPGSGPLRAIELSLTCKVQSRDPEDPERGKTKLERLNAISN